MRRAGTRRASGTLAGQLASCSGWFETYQPEASPYIATPQCEGDEPT